MSYTSTCGIELDTVMFGEFFNLAVLLQVLVRGILHVMVQSHDDLVGVVKLRGANRHEFQSHRPRIVVGHASMRTDSHVVTGLDKFPSWQSDSISLDNLLGKRLWHGSLGFHG